MSETQIKELIETAHCSTCLLLHTVFPFQSRGGSACKKRTDLHRMQYRECCVHADELCRADSRFQGSQRRVREFEAICIVGGPDGRLLDYTPPCGVCRQVMMEFCHPDEFQIILAKGKDDYRIL